MARVQFEKVRLKVPVRDVVQRFEAALDEIDSRITDEASAKEFVSDISKFIKESIETPWCSWLNEIKLNRNAFVIPGVQPSFNYKEARNELRQQINGILFELHYFDEYANPDLIRLENRARFKVEEVVNYTLLKLYSLRNIISGSIPLYQLLGGNGIQLSGSMKDGFANYLHENGFIEKPFWYDDAMVQLSIYGVQYVEENLLLENSDYLKDDPTEIQEILTALSGIELELRKLRTIGQIGSVELFEEIQDLKEALPNLKKKQWPQLLFGKIFDLLVKNVIDSQTAQSFFQMIFGKVKHLIKGSTDSIFRFLN